MAYFGEVITAMVTPFDENGKVDEQKLQVLVEHLITQSSDSLVVAGTTGEGPTLSKEEKLNLFSLVSKFSAGRVKVIANVGSNNTEETITFAKLVEKTGVDGIMLVNPYYNKPSQEGLYQHFSKIALSTHLPILLYNIPGRTAVNLEAKTTIRLSKIPNIIAVKESSGNLSQMAEIIENTSNEFYLYSGDDNLTLPILSLGGVGIVSVASHLMGSKIKEMVTLFKDGNVKEAASIHRKYLGFFEGLFFTTNPVVVKHLLNETGIPVGSVRLPLVDLSEEEKRRANELLKIYTLS